MGRLVLLAIIAFVISFIVSYLLGKFRGKQESETKANKQRSERLEFERDIDTLAEKIIKGKQK